LSSRRAIGVQLSPDNLRKFEARGVNYEGEFFWDCWQYSGGLDGSLIVEYGEGGGTGFVGKLSDAEIEEA
jgi:hypothetical protein